MSNKVKNLPAYGIWTVTTEGDCEGRSVRNLGTYEGYIDEIALNLAGRAYYGLRFEPAKQIEKEAKPGTSVQISLGIDTGTWDLKGPDRVAYFKKMLAGRNVSVSEGTYYACVKITDGDSPEEQERRANELKREQALAKLSAEERKLLGLGNDNGK